MFSFLPCAFPDLAHYLRAARAFMFLCTSIYNSPTLSTMTSLSRIHPARCQIEFIPVVELLLPTSPKTSVNQQFGLTPSIIDTSFGT
jgi:hypothetical protein